MRALRHVGCSVLALGFASSASAQALELEVGTSSFLQLKIRHQFSMPIVMPPSIFGPGIPGYARSEPEFHSAQIHHPAEDFFMLGPTANLRFVLLSKDPGVEVFNDTGTGYLPVGGQFFIGTAPFDTHPIWTIPNGTPGVEYDMSIKLIDVNHVYDDSAPFNLTFTPAGPVSQTYYWDTNGTTAGAGGSAPAGNWNGVATNFNTDAAGGAGTFVSAPTSADTVVFAAGSNATGNYTVNVSGTRAANTVKIEDGNVSLTGGTLAVATFEVSAGASGTVASNIAAPSTSLTKTGLGTLNVSKLPQNHAVNITGGTVRVLHSAPTGANPESDNNASVSQVSSLTIAPGATLDLTNNDLILDYTSSSPRAALEQLLRNGFNGGDWLGSGITSSTAAADSNFHLAIADNAELASPFGTANGGGLFSGVDVDLTSVLIKFTHRVDLDMDGLVTPNDSAIFGTNYDEGQPAYWAIGDIDMDGFFTPNDSAIFGTFYDEAQTSLPEPAFLSLVALAALAGLRVIVSRRDRQLGTIRARLVAVEDQIRVGRGQ